MTIPPAVTLWCPRCGVSRPITEFKTKIDLIAASWQGGPRADLLRHICGVYVYKPEEVKAIC